MYELRGRLGPWGPGEVLWTCCGGSRSGPLGLWGPGRPNVSPADFWHLLLQKVIDFFTKMHVDACLAHSSVFLSSEVCCQKSMKLVGTANKLLPTIRSNLHPPKSIFIDYSNTIHVQFAATNSIGAYFCSNLSESSHPKRGFGDFKSMNRTTNCHRTRITSIEIKRNKSQLHDAWKELHFIRKDFYRVFSRKVPPN